MKFWQLLIYPLSLIYGLIIWLRNTLFDLGVFRSKSFQVPVISVGNLSVGGTGKTPHVMYLLNLLESKFKVAELSRGYGRLSSGFKWATENSKVYEIGDEPTLIKKKFKNTLVAVDENRVRGIKTILKQHPEIQAIVLDDAFQHRNVLPSINILLTDYGNLYFNDYLMPSGTLREWRNGVRRADIIIVTKTPQVFSPLERRIIMQDINPKPYQRVYFSTMKYGSFTPMKNMPIKQKIDNEFYFSRNFSCLLITGIASSRNLLYYLKDHMDVTRHIEYPDHYRYTKKDIEKIAGIFENIKSENKIIVTTEKDAQRIMVDAFMDDIQKLPFFYLPIEVVFHEKENESFDEQILAYVGRN